jgi:hypothetical protein
MTNGPTTIDDDSSAAELDDENPAAADTAGDRDTSRDAGLSPLAIPAAKQWDALGGQTAARASEPVVDGLDGDAAGGSFCSSPSSLPPRRAGEPGTRWSRR